MFIIPATTDLLGGGDLFGSTYFFFLFFFVEHVMSPPVMERNRPMHCASSHSCSSLEAVEGRVQCFFKWSQSTWQFFSVCLWYLDVLWLSPLCFCVCVSDSLPLQIPLARLSRPVLVRWGERLHLSLPPWVQPLVSRTLLWAHVHPLHPGKTGHYRESRIR